MFTIEHRYFIYVTVEGQSGFNTYFNATSIQDLNKRLIRRFNRRFDYADYDWPTGNVPGIAASKSDTQEFGALRKPSFDAPENNFDLELICACTSNPTTLAYGSSLKKLIKKML